MQQCLFLFSLISVFNLILFTFANFNPDSSKFALDVTTTDLIPSSDCFLMNSFSTNSKSRVRRSSGYCDYRRITGPQPQTAPKKKPTHGTKGPKHGTNDGENPSKGEDPSNLGFDDLLVPLLKLPYFPKSGYDDDPWEECYKYLDASLDYPVCDSGDQDDIIPEQLNPELSDLGVPSFWLSPCSIGMFMIFVWSELLSTQG